MKTDSLLGRILRRWIPPLILLALFLGFVVQINQVDKVELISRDGQTFEKGVVTEILQDNLQPNGTQVGEQRVLVRLTTGVRAGQDLNAYATMPLDQLHG